MKNIRSRLASYAIWVLIGVLCLSLVKNVSRANQIKRQIQSEKDKLSKIESENNRLIDEIAKTQSTEFIEKEVRDKLGLAKEGEAIVVLPDSEVLKKFAPQATVEVDTLPDPTWKKWVKLFF
jgi:cell division protein FtsB